MRTLAAAVALVIAPCACSTPTAASSAARHVELGAPVYPGASSDAQGGVLMKTRDGVQTIAAFDTTDAFDKVDSFYEKRLPAGSEKLRMAGENGSVASFEVRNARSNGEITVQISSDRPKETTILITRVAKGVRI
jgi:hypothetical protein